MKVLFVSRRFPPEVVGGGEVSALLLARALRKAGVEAEVCTFGSGRPGPSLQLGVPVHRRALAVAPPWLPSLLAEREWVYAEMARQSSSLVAELKPDLLHALNLESIPAVAALGWKHSLPFVATLNSPWMLCYTGDGVDAAQKTCIDCRPRKRADCIAARSPRASRLARLVELGYSELWYRLFRRSALAAAHLFPISDGLRADLVQLGYPAARLTTVHNPVSSVASTQPSARAELGIPAGAFVAGFLGRLSPAKGIDLLLQAAARLQIHVLVVGRDEGAEAELRRLASALGIARRVHFVGYRPCEELGPLYTACDTVVMAGPFYEALGRMLMEASVHGVPAIARAAGGVPDVILDGETGLLLREGTLSELCGALQRLQAAPDLTAALGQAARQHMALHFSDDGAAATMIRVYGRLLPGLGVRAPQADTSLAHWSAARSSAVAPALNWR